MAADSDVDTDSWALLSDTHLWAKRDEVVHEIKMAEHFERVSGEVRALARKPAGLFINGDCAYLSGESEDYELLAQLLAPLSQHGLPIHMAMGNHDHRERFWTALNQTGTARPLAARQVSVVESPRVNWFMLDSLDETNKSPGFLGSEQLDWLSKALDAHADKPAFVFTHHHPDPGKPETGGLRDTDALYDVLVPRKHVKAYFFGHTHHWEIKQHEGLHLINLPAVAYVFNKTDPTGWVHCRLNDAGLSLELHSKDPAFADHGRQIDLAYRT